MHELTITPVDAECELDKRTHVPFMVSSECPKCGTRVEQDLSGRHHYLNYPTLSKPFRLNFYHECPEGTPFTEAEGYAHAEWQSPPVVLRVTLDPVLPAF